MDHIYENKVLGSFIKDMRLRLLERMILTYLLELRFSKAMRVEKVLRMDGYFLKTRKCVYGPLQCTKYLHAF